MSAPDVVGDTDWVALAADVVAGRIRDGKTQAAILKAEHYLRAEAK